MLSAARRLLTTEFAALTTIRGTAGAGSRAYALQAAITATTIKTITKKAIR